MWDLKSKVLAVQTKMPFGDQKIVTWRLSWWFKTVLWAFTLHQVGLDVVLRARGTYFDYSWFVAATKFLKRAKSCSNTKESSSSGLRDARFEWGGTVLDKAQVLLKTLAFRSCEVLPMTPVQQRKEELTSIWTDTSLDACISRDHAQIIGSWNFALEESLSSLPIVQEQVMMNTSISPKLGWVVVCRIKVEQRLP